MWCNHLGKLSWPRVPVSQWAAVLVPEVLTRWGLHFFWIFRISVPGLSLGLLCGSHHFIQIREQVTVEQSFQTGSSRLGILLSGQRFSIALLKGLWHVSAKSLQPCPTLCDPMDCSQPGLSICGISLGKNTGVGCHAFLQGIFPAQGSNPGLLRLLIAGRFFTTSATWGKWLMRLYVFLTPAPSRLTHTLQCENVLFFCLCGQFSYQPGLHPICWEDIQRVSVFSYWSVAQQPGHASQSAVKDLLDFSCERSLTAGAGRGGGCPGPLWESSGMSGPHVQNHTWRLSHLFGGFLGAPIIILAAKGVTGDLGSFLWVWEILKGLEVSAKGVGEGSAFTVDFHCWGVSNVLTRKMLLREENQQDGKSMSSWRFLLSS